jgi:hypothetical protein
MFVRFRVLWASHVQGIKNFTQTPCTVPRTLLRLLAESLVKGAITFVYPCQVTIALII